MRQIDTDVAADSIMCLLRGSGGATYSLTLGSRAGASAYAVCIKPRHSVVVDLTASRADLVGFINCNLDQLTAERRAVGVWFDAETNRTSIDIVTVMENRFWAIIVAKANHQYSVYSLRTGRAFPAEKEEAA